jgi:1,4-alpha-glucan branching enzyme
MTVTQQYISSATPMGANLHGDGATFRVWARRAKFVHVVGNFGSVDDWEPNDSNRLVRNENGYWAGYLHGARDGDHYKFYVIGEARESYKRDPYARELSSTPAYPNCNCVVRNPASYEWRNGEWRRPAFHNLIIYQLHVGTFAASIGPNRVGCFLDVLERFDHLMNLGVNAIQMLPVVEFSSPRSLGYDGSDLFSPEMDYTLEGDAVDPYLDRVNHMFMQHGKPGMAKEELAVPVNQLKVLVDLCHLNGISLLLDVVYNHAGHQIISQEQSIWFFDWEHGPDPNQSLYFTDRTHTGPVFAVWKQEVRQFLIDNANFFLSEYHVDGLRYDQVSVILSENGESGWRFCRDCTSALRSRHPDTLGIAEHWPVDANIVQPPDQGGAGFDAAWSDGLRKGIREAVSSAAGDAGAIVNMRGIADALWAHPFPEKWRVVQYVESHDEVYRDRSPRMAMLADASNPRSWYARSRARFATGLLLAAPGIPMLFMGQEFLEDKQWSDDPGRDERFLLYWAGLDGNDRHMQDFLRFVSDAIQIRRSCPGLTGEGFRVILIDEENRILAFQRWVEGIGYDVVVVASLNENPLYGYRLGMPYAGTWIELLNSDYYDFFPNEQTKGNDGFVNAIDMPMHDLAASAELTIPPNAVLIFVKN